MKSKISLCFLAAALAAPVCSGAQLFSWETGLEGWTAGGSNSVATSTTGATDGVQSLAVTQPMSGMNWNAAASLPLSPQQMQSIFTDATELKIDVHYPNPGYTSWFGNPHVELIIQGSGVGWTGLASREVTVDAASQTLTFPLTAAQAANMASSSWGQIILRFDYGNGGATSENVVFYLDNFTNTVVVDPPPVTNFYWKGGVNNQWTSLNWTSDPAGIVPGGALPTDGSAGIAFAASGASNLTSVLGVDQEVNSIVVTAGVSPTLGGSHSLAIGAGGIWMDETAAGLTIDTSGGVVIAADQAWRNKSVSPMVVNSAISGSGKLTKSGAGPLRLGVANTYTGGTVLELGALTLDHASALGGNAASLTVNGGSVDLNGLNVTLGALSGMVTGVIHNTSSVTPSVLTLDVATDSAYACRINDGPGGAPVSLVKKGSATVTSNGSGSFTGPMSIENGLFVANIWSNNPPNFSAFGNAQVAGRTITVTAPGEISLTSNNVFGNGSADPSLLPEILVNNTTVTTSRYNQIGNVTLNAGTLFQSSSDTGNYLGYQFKGRIKVTGTGPSTIASNGAGNHLSSDTVFEVANVTGDSDDLLVSAPLLDQSGDYASAPGGLTKTGAGTLSLEGSNSYTGNTKVLGGVLRISSATLSDTARLEIATGAVLNLTHSETDRVAALTIGNQTMVGGIYGAQNSGAQFERTEITGTGFIEVVSDRYLSWIADFPALSGQDAEKGADPDHDGITNIGEFALDGDPSLGTPSGKVRSRLEIIGTDQALVITLPVRDDASFSGVAPAIATAVDDEISYEIGGSNDLIHFDQEVAEVIPALTGSPDMPELNAGWTYRTFRLVGPAGGITLRGPKGFLRAKVTEIP